MAIKRRHRHQTGTVWLKSGSWYLRYYTSVSGERKQVAKFLARKDDKHHSATCKPVKSLAAELIARENSGAVEDTEKAPTLAAFWTDSYEPWMVKKHRLSTSKSYSDLWTRHVKEE